jgi:hypothetical protein
MPPNEAETPVELIRAMTPARKLEIVHGLWQTAWELTTAGVRAREPGLSESEVTARVREIFLSASA